MDASEWGEEGRRAEVGDDNSCLAFHTKSHDTNLVAVGRGLVPMDLY